MGNIVSMSLCYEAPLRLVAIEFVTSTGFASQ